jgi:pimeloyl-ACP methyl ester carboxylesterase
MSMGGYVAFEFCRRHAARVRALVLTNTRARPDTEDEARGRHEMAARVRSEGAPVVAEAMLPKLFSPDTPESLRAHWRALMAATPAEGVAAALEAMAAREDSFGTLRRLTCPVMIVAGADDVITPPDDSRRMHEATPGSRLVILVGTGHMSAAEAPERFADTLRGFLEANR